MTTKIQSKSYLPGYSLMGDLNEDPNNMWSMYFLDRKVNEHVYDNHLQRHVNEYSSNGKDLLKRAMLEHEMLFRNQVYELHRLYRVQKDMMDEFQTRGLHISVPAETSHSNSSLPQMQSKNYQMTQQSSSHSAMVKNCHKNVLQSGFIADKNSSSFQGNISSEYIVRSHSRRMLDLHLPADSYIDLEDEDTSERKEVPKSSTYSAEIPRANDNSDSIVKLTLGIDENNSNKQADCLFGLRARNSIPVEIAGSINNHTAKTYAAQPQESASFKSLGMRTRTESNIGHHVAMRSKSNPDDELTNKYSVSDLRSIDGEHFPSFTTNESAGNTGKGLFMSSQSLYNQRYLVTSGQLQANPNKIHGSHSPDSNKLATWFQRKPINVSLEGSLNNFRSTSLLASAGSNPLNGMSCHPTSTTPCLNVLSNVMANGVHAARAIQNVVATSEIPQNDDNLTSGQGGGADSFESYPSFHVSGAHQPFLPEKLNHMDNISSSVKGNDGYQSNSASSLVASKEINLNQALPCAIDDSLNEEVDLMTHERRNEHLPVVPSWLRKAECSKQSVNLNLLASDMESTFSDDCGKVNDKKVQTNNASGYTNTIPNSFTVSELTENINQDLPSVFEQEDSSSNNLKRKGRDNLLLDDLNCDKKMSRSKKNADDGELHNERFVEKDDTNSKSLINLNVEFICSDEEAVSNSMVENILPSSYLSSDTKASSKIDLVVTMCHGENIIESEHEVTKTDDRMISEEKEWSPDVLASLAAENIVAISLHQSSHDAEVTCHLVSPPSYSLHWLAEVALSNNEGTKVPSKGEDVNLSLDNHVLDLFEAMTLELEEVKVHDSCHNMNEPENKENTDNEDIGVASQLFTRRRRGQSRRCRQQRKDFKKDVLPGLATLSRHEVTEDLQLIEGLMRASGSSWQSGLGKRNSGRKGTNSRAKGRRRITNVANCAATSTEIQASPPSPQCSLPNNTVPEVIGSSIIGWGRTTRRCRRQRSLPGHIVSSLA